MIPKNSCGQLVLIKKIFPQKQWMNVFFLIPWYFEIFINEKKPNFYPVSSLQGKYHIQNFQEICDWTSSKWYGNETLLGKDVAS